MDLLGPISDTLGNLDTNCVNQFARKIANMDLQKEGVELGKNIGTGVLSSL